jgi:hypothetical protein
VPNSVVNSNAAASIRGGARGKHAGAEYNVYLGEHSTAKRAVLYILV